MFTTLLGAGRGQGRRRCGHVDVESGRRACRLDGGRCAASRYQYADHGNGRAERSVRKTGQGESQVRYRRLQN